MTQVECVPAHVAVKQVDITPHQEVAVNRQDPDNAQEEQQYDSDR
jgi:hypothetical protein